MDDVNDNPLQPGAIAIVTVLGPGAHLCIRGCVLESAGDLLRVSLPAPIASGAALMIESADALFLGEVCGSEAIENGFRAGVRISHALNSLSDLQRLNRAILGHGSPRRDGSAEEREVSLVRRRVER